MRNVKLFAPGPVNTSERVKKSLAIPDMCHRKKDFEEILESTIERILMVTGCSGHEYTAAVISGSGTAANESIYASSCDEKDTVLLIKNGEFGNRIEEILDCYGIKKRVAEFEWGEAVDPERVESILENDSGITMIAMVYHETSSGLINPVEKIGLLAKRYKKIFHVDAVSAVGGEPLDLVKMNISICSGVPNKAVSGFPGCSFVVLKKSMISRIDSIRQKSVYLSLKKHIKFFREYRQTPNTPSVIMISSLNEALSELLDEGLENRIGRYRKNAGIIREMIAGLGLKYLNSDSDALSSTVTTVFLPVRYNVNELLKEMEKRGYVFYEGKGRFREQNAFQIANMGSLDRNDCLEMCGVFESVLKNL